MYGQYFKKILELSHTTDAQSEIYSEKKLTRWDARKALKLIALEITCSVAMSGGALAAWDLVANLVKSCSLKLGELPIFSNFDGAKLMANLRALPPDGQVLFFPEDNTALPGDGETALAHITLPLLYCDSHYKGGSRYHRFPSEIIPHLKFSLTAGVDADVDANATITNCKFRLMAYGHDATRIVCAPIPHYVRHETVSEGKEIGYSKERIRSLVAIDTSGFSEHADEIDQLQVNGKNYYGDGVTVGDLQRAQKNQRKAIAGVDSQTFEDDSLSTNYPLTQFLYYVSPFGDMGDSPVRRGEGVVFEPGSSRKLHMVRYRRWTPELYEQIAEYVGKENMVPEVLEADGLSFGPYEESTLPVSFGQYAA